jgi:hypothetical protein
MRHAGLNYGMQARCFNQFITLCTLLTVATLLLGCATPRSDDDSSQSAPFKQWRRTTATILDQSHDATFVAVSLYLDGGSLGYSFTNHLGIITAFLPNPGIEDKEMGLVRNQRIFLGQPESGLKGIELKSGSQTERKLKTLVQTAAAKDMPPEYRAELDRFLEGLTTREFDWQHPEPEE